MATDNDKRVNVSVGLNPAARDMVENIRVETGVPQVTAIQRWLEFLAKMPRKFQLAALQNDEAGQQEMLIAWFKETMEAHGKQIDITEGDYVSARAKLAKQLIDELTLAYAQERAKNGEKPKKKG